MRVQLGEKFVEAESGGGGITQHLSGEGPQPAIVLVRRAGVRGVGAYERPDTASRFNDACAFQLAVDAGYGVGVDTQLDSELSDRWELVAEVQSTGGDGRAQPSIELRVNWRSVAWIQLNDSH